MNTQRLKRWLKDKTLVTGTIIFFALFIFAVSICWRIDLHTWDSTLNTIIQALAALLAMGGAFFIFKVPQIDDEISKYRNRMFHFLSITRQNKASNYFDLSNSMLRQLFMQGITTYNFVEVRNLFKTYEHIPLDDPELQKQALKNWLRLFDDNIEKKCDVLGFLKISVTLITTTILVSILLLFFTDTIPTTLVLVVPVYLFCLSTFYIGRAILNITKH